MVMELRLNLNYNQILRLIHQLPDKDKERLASTLQSELYSKKTTTIGKIQNLILEAPTWNEEQLSDYQTAREHIKKSRLI